MTASFRIELGKGVYLDPRTLVDTRMLVAGSSGSGKSYAMRVLAEQAAPKLQTFVLDPEGEYTTLREKIDLVIVGRDGEVAPTVATAAKLARKLLELEVSAVIDLYDLKVQDRRAFVKNFLDSMMTAPKSLWRPCLVMLDEAHKFCPERSSGHAESTDAVITLLSQGRKRGYCAILSTQRLQKLHKDAAAETLNNLIGRTSLDTDVHRARDILGLAKADEKALRALQPGNWYGFGPAFIDGSGKKLEGVSTFKARRATTTHPEPGKRHTLRPPAPSARIRKVLPELAELPQAVKEEEVTLEGLHRQIRKLTGELATAKRGNGRSSVVDPEVVERKVQAAVASATDRLVRQTQAIQSKNEKQISKQFEQIRVAVNKLYTGFDGVKAALDNVDIPKASESTFFVEMDKARPWPKAIEDASQPRARVREPKTTSSNGVPSGGMRRIMLALACTGGCSRSDLAIISMISPNSGTYRTYLGLLKGEGKIAADDGRFFATKAGLAALGDYAPIPTHGADLCAQWSAKIGGGGIGRMFEALADAGPKGLSHDELGERSQIAKSGTFRTYVGTLRKHGITEGRGWPIRLASIFFD